MANLSFETLPWEAFPPHQDQNQSPLRCKRNVPYLPNSNALETLNLYIPTLEHVGLTSSTGIWLVYIHGGAWRDPQITADSFEPTIQRFLDSHPIDHIAGFASLNYSLSIYPHHTDPKWSTGRTPPPERAAKHPQHIRDVLSGIAWLQHKYGFGHRFILVGHSCGATLAIQTVMALVSEPQIVSPMAIVGLNGLYDLPLLVDDPGVKHEHLKHIYKTFTTNAFGTERSLWKRVSPASIRTGDWTSLWPDNKLIAIAQSNQDTLVPMNQEKAMIDSLRGSESEGTIPASRIRLIGIQGDHNDIWADGDQLAEILASVVDELHRH